MYFRSVIRKNPITQKYEGYYRLIESYRNENDRICHRTLLTIGFIDYDGEKLSDIQRILNNRLQRKEYLFEENAENIVIANEYWTGLVKTGKVDESPEALLKEKRMIYTDTIKHKDVKEVGAEWICYQALQQLKIEDFLKRLDWKNEMIQLALTQIVSRAVYPYSELRTSKWIKENSAICEITGYKTEKITKDKLYKSALDLFNIKDSLEQHLSKRTNELFDLEDKIILYDLTNTYFEGVKINSKLAKFGRSKEKRSDAKLIVLALVVNIEGFIKYSNIFEGNKSDSQSLPEIIDQIRLQTSHEQRATVVLDAGIATNENLELILAKGYNYVCVSRAKIKDYVPDTKSNPIEITTKNNKKVKLQRVISKEQTDYILKIQSEGKHAKEDSMKMKFETLFLEQVNKINLSLHKKKGVKQLDKVYKRIGRLMEKYPSMNKYYTIVIEEEKGLATEVKAIKTKEYQKLTEGLGEYFIRTNLQTEDQETVWAIYNTIREIESAFRCLKTDLDLRPIYHKNDTSTLAHLHLGLLAYWLVNTIRYQLKTKGINSNWQEIIRIGNTQKIITTSGQNKFDEVISVRKCSEPSVQLKQLYGALNFKSQPYTKRKSVVHKSEFENFEPPEKRNILT